MTQTPNLALDYLLANQAQKHVTVNENTRRLDALLHICAESRSLTAPPDASDGARYIPAAGATGAWAGQGGKLAAFQDGGWSFETPRTGWCAWIRDEDVMAVHVDGAWVAAVPLDETARLGIGTPPDPAHALSVAGDSTLLSHTGEGHRLLINRANATETASVIFQTAFSGGAEIGLATDGNLTFKAGSDLGALPAAVTIEAGTGFMGIGTTNPENRLHLCQELDARLMIETSNASSGGGFDISNSRSGQRWRVTGQSNLFKIRDHSGGIDKLTVHAGASGAILLENSGNVGIGTSTPTTKLHVAGLIRSAPRTLSELPAASAAGGGSLAFVTDGAGGARFAYSDGSAWRWMADGASVS